MPNVTSTPATDTLSRMIGARVRAERLERGLSQLALAELAGISERTIVGVELGGNPRAETIEAIARGLGIAPAELLTAS